MKAFARDTSGATAIEYAMIASVVSIMVVAGAFQIGQTVKQFFLDTILPNL